MYQLWYWCMYVLYKQHVFLENGNIVFLLIIFLKVLQQVTALQGINCVSVTAGQDHTVVVTDE